MVDAFSFGIEKFKDKFAKGGARPNLFRVEVDITGTGASVANEKLTFTCRAASLPPQTLGTIEVPFYGRKVKVAGDRTFPEWSITVLNDEDFSVRKGFELWNNKINLHKENVRENPYDIVGAGLSSYKRNATVYHYNKKGDVIAAYSFLGMYPSEVSPIDLAWDTNDTIEEFTVTLQYDYWQSIPLTTEGVSGATIIK